MRAFGTLAAIFISLFAQAQSLTYEGTLFDSGGNLIAEPGIKLKAEIFDNALTCVLYEREYTLDLSASNGHFTLDLSTGTVPGGQPHSANSLPQILSNTNGNNVTCADSSVRSFNGTFVKRQIRISILEVNSIDIADIQLPAQDLELTPFANEAETAKLFTGSLSGDVSGTSGATQVEKIQGVAVDSTTPIDGQVLKYVSGSSKYIPATIDSSAIADNSLSVNDVDFASSNGIDLPALTAAPGAPSAGQIYYNSVDNKVYFYNGSGWIDTGAGGGDFLASGAVALTGNINLNGNYLSGDGDSEGVYVDLSGNVGVGTASPTALLELDSPSTVNPLTIDADGSATDANRALNFDVDGNNYAKILLPAGAGGDMAFWTGSAGAAAERVRIDNTGRVGIGVTNPARMLDIERAERTTTFVPGTISSWADIEMMNPTDTLNAATGIRFSVDAGGADVAGIAAVKEHASNNALGLAFIVDPDGSAAFEALRISDEGNVGIGISSPTADLHINNSTSVFKLEHSSGGWAALFNNTSTPAADTLLGTYQFKGLNDTGVEINYTDVRGFVTDDTTGSEDGYMKFRTMNSGTLTEAMRIDNNGNVGIGTMSPQAVLDVEGDIEILTGAERLRWSSKHVGPSDYRSYLIPRNAADTDWDYAQEFGYHWANRAWYFDGHVGVGTTDPEGALDVSSTTAAFVPPRMTEVQRDAISSPVDGSIIYNTTTDKLNIRENGSWVAVGSGGYSECAGSKKHGELWFEQGSSCCQSGHKTAQKQCVDGTINTIFNDAPINLYSCDESCGG